jgi:hypothetical protein
MLTKWSILAMMPIPFILWLAVFWRRRETLLYPLILGLIVALLVGPYAALRLSRGETLKPVGNAESLQYSLRVTTTPWCFFSFNPAKMVEIPWVESRGETTRRENLWEYQFRSFYFGEFPYQPWSLPLARVIVVLGLAALYVAAGGLFSSIVMKRSEEFPILLVLALYSTSAIVARYQYPFSCTQDFRYLTPLVVPGTLYWLRGISAAGAGMRTVWLSAGVLLSFSCAIFLIFAPFGENVTRPLTNGRANSSNAFTLRS